VTVLVKHRLNQGRI